jgi:hypothetical protein
MDFFQIIIGRYIFNYIGGTIRWIYGSIWRTIFNKPKFSYKEYISGPKNSKDHFDEFGHQFNNRLIGIGFLVGIVILLLN